MKENAEGSFYFRGQGRKGAKIDAEIIRWVWLPPIDERWEV